MKSLKGFKKRLGLFIEERVLGSFGARWPIYSLRFRKSSNFLLPRSEKEKLGKDHPLPALFF